MKSCSKAKNKACSPILSRSLKIVESDSSLSMRVAPGAVWEIKYQKFLFCNSFSILSHCCAISFCWSCNTSDCFVPFFKLIKKRALISSASVSGILWLLIRVNSSILSISPVISYQITWVLLNSFSKKQLFSSSLFSENQSCMVW